MGKRRRESVEDKSQHVADQLCRRIRELRAQREWSLDELSAACGVSRSMLSQIERNQANPTLAVAFRIAEAFEMSLGELVETPEATSRIDVVRSEDRAHFYRSDDDCQIRTLSPLHLEKDVEMYEIRLRGNGLLRSAPHFEGTREFLTVQKGRIRIESAGDDADLKRGDSASYRADVSHCIQNLGRSEASVLLVVIYR